MQLEDPRNVPLTRKPWTDADTARLQEVWPVEIKTSAQLRKVAKSEKTRITSAIGRSWTVVKTKLKLLPGYQVVRLDKPWEPDELHILQTFYHRKPLRKIAKLLNRTYTSVAQQASRLDTDIRANHHWTKEEDELLAELWACSGFRKLRASFPTRSLESIQRRAKKDLQLGPRLQGYVSLSECARQIGVSLPLMKHILEWGKLGYMMAGKRRLGIDLLDATDVAKEWFALETAPQAAARHNVRSAVLYSAVRRVGTTEKKPNDWYRMAPSEWDRILVEYRASFKRKHVEPVHVQRPGVVAASDCSHG